MKTYEVCRRKGELREGARKQGAETSRGRGMGQLAVV